MPRHLSSLEGALLAGAVVQRADVAAEAAVLKVRQPGATAYVIVVAGQGVAVSAEKVGRPEGGRAEPKLEGFRVVGLTARGAVLQRGDERAAVEITRGPGGGRVTVRALAEGESLGDAAPEAERAAFEARGAPLAEAMRTAALEARRGEVSRAIRKGIARLERRAEAVRKDLGRIGDAEALAAQAQWLIAEAVRAPRGARSLRVTDWSSGEARILEVPLDPAKPARAQVEAMFQRARRLKLGAAIAAERLAQTERALAGVQEALRSLETAGDMSAVEGCAAGARAAAPRDVTFEARAGEGRARGGQARSLPYRTFRSRSGERVLVGRGAAHNDALTFHVARPHDLWLHAKGKTGAHVIVPLAKGHTCPADLLVDAAHLAAHFSDARDEAVVDVQYASRRHLRKPRGSAPGLAVVDREKVLALRRDPAILRALLDAEEEAEGVSARRT